MVEALGEGVTSKMRRCNYTGDESGFLGALTADVRKDADP